MSVVISVTLIVLDSDVSALIACKKQIPPLKNRTFAVNSQSDSQTVCGQIVRQSDSLWSDSQTVLYLVLKRALSCTGPNI
jgi:hypothetical protein